MTREELKEHCERQIQICETWAISKGEEPHGKVYEEHKLILELLEQEPFMNKPCVSEKVCEHDKNVVVGKIRAEIEGLPTKTRINWDGCCPDIDYPEIEYIDVTKKKLLEIIDKYRSESEG